MVEYEWEEMAEMAVQELQSVLDIENQAAIEEHKIIDSFNAWEHIFAHIDEKLQEDDTVHETLADVQLKLTEARTIIEEGDIRNLSLRKEEREILKKLKEDIAHKDWRAVKQEMGEEKELEEVSIRAEAAELKQLHSLIIEMQRSLKEIAEKDEYIKQIYESIKAYERIFRKLWEKERLFLK